jgi:hypothetical protein
MVAVVAAKVLRAVAVAAAAEVALLAQELILQRLELAELGVFLQEVRQEIRLWVLVAVLPQVAL